MALYGYLSALQSLLWLTFSSVPESSKAFLGTNDDTLSLFLDWGPVAFCFSVFPAQYLLSTSRTGLRDSIRLGYALCLFAALLRLFPIFITDAQRAEQGTLHSASLACVHIAQFINGAVAPLAVASPSYLSLLWFPEEERNSATAIANVSNALGRAVGFFLGPALVHGAGDVKTLLLVCVGCAALPCLAALAFLPALPQQPPSAAAEREAARWANHAPQEPHWQVLEDADAAAGKPPPPATAISPSMAEALAQAGRACSHAPFLAACLSGGVTMAFFGAWSGELTPALTAGGAFTDAQAGSIGSLCTFAGIAGGIAAGAATDAPLLQRSLKAVIAGLALASAALFLPLALALPPLSGVLPPAASAWLSFPTLMALCGAAGFLRGGMDPLFFELASDTAWEVGVGADMAGSVLTLLYHLLLCATLSMPAKPLMAIVLVGMPVALVVGVGLLALVRVGYGRRGGQGEGYDKLLVNA